MTTQAHDAPTHAQAGPRRSGLPVLGREVPLYSTHGMSREEWVRRRLAMRSVGASQVASVLGWSPWESPLTEWEAITGRREKFPSDPMVLGTTLEPLIRAHYGEVTGRDVRPWPIVLRHPTVERLTCNLDAVSGRGPAAPWVIELKYSGSRYRAHWREFREHGDPERMRGTSLYGYWLQIQTQLEITGLDEGELFAVVGEEAALKLVLNAMQGLSLTVPSDDVFSFHVRRDPEVGAWIAEQVARFAYWHLDQDAPPAPTRPIDLAAVRRLLAPEGDGEPEERDDLVELVAEAGRLASLAEEHRHAAATAKAKLVAAFGRFGAFKVGGRMVIHRKDKNGRAYLRGIGADE